MAIILAAVLVRVRVRVRVRVTVKFSVRLPTCSYEVQKTMRKCAAADVVFGPFFGETVKLTNHSNVGNQSSFSP